MLCYRKYSSVILAIKLLNDERSIKVILTTCWLTFCGLSYIKTIDFNQPIVCYKNPSSFYLSVDAPWTSKYHSFLDLLMPVVEHFVIANFKDFLDIWMPTTLMTNIVWVKLLNQTIFVI